MCPTSRSLWLELAAVHEAGHAVAAIAVGFEVDWIELYPAGHADQPDVGGTTHVIYPQPMGPLTTNLTMIWAGQAAQLRHLSRLQRYTGYTHDVVNDLVNGSCRDDLAEIDRALREAGVAAQPAESPAAARRLADQLVADHWDAVRQVASRILTADSHRLNGAEVHRLCQHISARYGQQPEPDSVEAAACRR